MLVFVDNYDSFTWNLVQAWMALGETVEVLEAKMATSSAIEKLRADRLVIGPGPGLPDGTVSLSGLWRHFHGMLPILGVCLGHQALALAFKGRLKPVATILHGRHISLKACKGPLLHNLEDGTKMISYHSWVVDENHLPPQLEVTAWDTEGQIMALSHHHHPSFGLQFHPESILSEKGTEVLGRFLSL